MPTATFPEQHVALWRHAGIGAEVLRASCGHLVVTRRGARAVPFDDRGRPLLWLAPVVRLASAPTDPDLVSGRGAEGAWSAESNPAAALGAWASGDAWNFGAERLWIGPELRLMVADRDDFHGTYHLDPALDPGAWQLGTAAGSGGSPATVVLRQEMTLPVQQPTARLGLLLEQRIALCADPARRWPEATHLKHLGWSREVVLERGPDDDGSVACQSWVIAQLEAPATVLVPGAGDARVTDYFEPIDQEHLERRSDGLAIAITARQRFKVGVATGEHRSTIACWRSLPDDKAALYVRFFADTPSSRYLEQPPGDPAHEGDSLYSYNDDGDKGNFGEIEALGRALEPGTASLTDRFELHVWWGDRARVRDLAAKLLGMETLPASEESEESR